MSKRFPSSHPRRPINRYTPQRARRLATQTRWLWTNMLSTVRGMLDLADAHDADTLAEQRMQLRTFELVLRGYLPEHRLWVRLRQAGADRDDDCSLWKFLNEVRDILESRLENLESEVATFAKGFYGTTPDEHFGQEFCIALTGLRSLYSDWSTVARLLDSVDDQSGYAIDDLEVDDQLLTEIETRTRERRQRLQRSD